MTARSRLRASEANVITDGWGRPKLARVNALIPASQHEWMSELVAQAQDAGEVRVGNTDIVAWAISRLEQEANEGVDLTAELVDWFETSRRSV